MWQDYELPKTAKINNEIFAIRSDYRCILDIFYVLNEQELTELEKIICALKIFYVDFKKITDIKKAVEIMFLFINGNRKEKSKTNSPVLMDWQQDLPLIIPPINRILGYEIRNVEYLHWWTFLGAFMEIGECTFNTFVGIRSKRLKGKKLEKYESEIYRENKDKIDIQKRYDKQTQELLDEIMNKGGD